MGVEEYIKGLDKRVRAQQMGVQVLKEIPKGIEQPEVGIEDGIVMISWYRSHYGTDVPLRGACISIDGTDTYSYWYLDKKWYVDGKEEWVCRNPMPGDLIEYLERWFKEE